MPDRLAQGLCEARAVVVCGHGSVHEVVKQFAADPVGVIIFALDPATALAAMRAGLVAAMPPDVLADDQLEAIEAEARRIGEGLIERASGQGPEVEIARNPTAVPALDRDLAIAFLARLLEVDAALESLDAAGVAWRNAVVAKRRVPAAHERATPQTLLEELVPDYLRVVSRPRGRPHWRPQRRSRGVLDVLPDTSLSEARRLVDRLRVRRNARRDFTDFFVPSDIPRGAVVLLGRTIEFRRNRGLIDELRAGCEELVIGSLDHSYRGAIPKIAALAAETGISPVLTPKPKWLLKSLYSVRFRWRLLRWAADSSRPQVPSRERGSVLLRRAVGAFLAERWAAMAWDWRAWKSAVGRSRPGIIIGFRTAPSVHIPLHAGLAAGVPAFTLPHGVVEEDAFRDDEDGLLAHLTPFARMGELLIRTGSERRGVWSLASILLRSASTRLNVRILRLVSCCSWMAPLRLIEVHFARGANGRHWRSSSSRRRTLSSSSRTTPASPRMPVSHLHRREFPAAWSSLTSSRIFIVFSGRARE